MRSALGGQMHVGPSQTFHFTNDKSDNHSSRPFARLSRGVCGPIKQEIAAAMGVGTVDRMDALCAGCRYRHGTIPRCMHG